MMAKYALYAVMFALLYVVAWPFVSHVSGAHHNGKLVPARDMDLKTRYAHQGRHFASL